MPLTWCRAAEGHTYSATIHRKHLGLLASGVGLYATVTAPWVPTLIDTALWDTWIAAIVVLSLIAAATIYVIGHARIRDNVTDKQAIDTALGAVEKA